MSTYRITKDFGFSASHFLTGLPEDHPCARLHGHNYTVRVALEGPLVVPGFVRDYGDLSAFKDYLDTQIDHRHLGAKNLYSWDEQEPRELGSFPPLEEFARAVVTFNPTAENMAKFFFDILRNHLHFPEVVAVGVSETNKTWAWYDSGEIIETDWRTNG